MVGTRDTYKKRYKMRAVGEGALNIVVSIPRRVVEREAERHGLSLVEFLDQFRAIAQYNDFDGILYTFEEIASESKESARMAPDSSA